MKYFAVSDTHFGHWRICEYCNRPFKSLIQMNERLINNWNQRVKPDDIVYHLGDFCFRNSPNAAKRGEGEPVNWLTYWNKLNGHKVLVAGNHDCNNSARTLIKGIHAEFAGLSIWMTHRPEDVPQVYGCGNGVDLVIHGHIHNSGKSSWRNGIPYINVSVEEWNYYPVDMNEIVKLYHFIKKSKNSACPKQ